MNPLPRVELVWRLTLTRRVKNAGSVDDTVTREATLDDLAAVLSALSDEQLKALLWPRYADALDRASAAEADRDMYRGMALRGEGWPEDFERLEREKAASESARKRGEVVRSALLECAHDPESHLTNEAGSPLAAIEELRLARTRP